MCPFKLYYTYFTSPTLEIILICLAHLKWIKKTYLKSLMHLKIQGYEVRPITMRLRSLEDDLLEWFFLRFMVKGKQNKEESVKLFAVRSSPILEQTQPKKRSKQHSIRTHTVIVEINRSIIQMMPQDIKSVFVRYNCLQNDEKKKRNSGCVYI